MEEIDKDLIRIYEILLERSKNTLEEHKKSSEKIADLMPKLKTKEGRQVLAEITQSNYATMIDLEIDIAQDEKFLKELKENI